MYNTNKKKTRGKEIITATLMFLLVGCGVPPEDWGDTKPKWIMATKYLPKEQLQGLQNAGFFEIGDKIYTHHCDPHGNMIRHRFDEEYKLWKQVKYETHGCGDPDA